MTVTNKHILIIVDSIDVNDSSASKGRVALIKNLAIIGFKLTVLHYTRKEINLDCIKCIAIPEKKFNQLYILSRLQRILQRIFKINLAKYLEPIFGFSFTFFNDVKSIKSALKNIDVSKLDLVLTLSKAASFRPHYAINKLPEFHNKWMAYIHDPYPFSCYPMPYDWKEPGYKIKERFFKTLSNNAQYSAFPSLLLKEWMGSHFINFNKTGIVFPHQLIELDTTKIALPSFFESNKFTLLHAGNLMKPRNPEGLIIGFIEFLKKNPKAKKDACLLFVGDASYHGKMLRQYELVIPELSLQIKKINFDVAYKLQKQVSVNIILEAKAEISPFLPGKFPHCVSANKPILHLGPKKSEVFRLLGNDYEYHSEIDDFEEIASLIGKLYNKWKENKDDLALNRKDIEIYISSSFLKEQITNLE